MCDSGPLARFFVIENDGESKKITEQLARIEQLKERIMPVLESIGYEGLDVVISGTHRITIRIIAEPIDGSAMMVDKCAEVSRALFDVENPIEQPYTLEVSSPGIERALIRPKDFERFSGHDVQIRTHRSQNGQCCFCGLLRGVIDECIHLEIDGKIMVFP